MITEAPVIFDQTMSDLISQLEKFTAAEFNDIPYTGSWTAGQVADHLYKSYGVVRTLEGNVIPATRPVDEKIAGIKELFLNFDIKISSPEAILPSTLPVEKDDLMMGLINRISQFKDQIAREDLSLICTDYAIPEYGPFTRLEWVYFTIYHTRRHVYQL